VVQAGEGEGVWSLVEGIGEAGRLEGIESWRRRYGGVLGSMMRSGGGVDT
jgi:hypothetical protein